MEKYRPPKIEDIGLEKYLNDTMAQHNGFHYDGFVRMLESEVNPANIARAFTVDRRTAIKWIEIHKKEKAKNRAST